MDNRLGRKKVHMEIRRECGKTRVFIDGAEVTRIRKAGVAIEAGNIPVVTLELMPESVDITTLADVCVREAKLGGT